MRDTCLISSESPKEDVCTDVMKYFQPDLFGSDPKMRSRQFSKKFIDAVQSNFNNLEIF
jgi:hypothetical protein